MKTETTMSQLCNPPSHSILAKLRTYIESNKSRTEIFIPEANDFDTLLDMNDPFGVVVGTFAIHIPSQKKYPCSIFVNLTFSNSLAVIFEHGS